MSEPRKIRYAVVGLGNIAQAAVLPAFRHAKENSKLVALVSSDDQKLSELSGRYAVPHTGRYEDLERVLELSRADAVYVAVPNSRHRDIVVRAANCGVHSLCEKPLATTEDDAWTMIDTCRENDVRLMVGYRLHFEAANLRAIEIARSGQLGELRLFTSVFCHQVREGDIRTSATLGGGALFDLGIYCINAARNLFREEPVEVFASMTMGTDPRFVEVDEMTSCVMRFSRGRIAQFTASQGAASVSSFRLAGSNGNLRVDEAYSYTDEIREELLVDGRREARVFPRRDQFAPELVYFSKCILEGKEPEPSGEEGLCDVRVMCAIAESARTGTAVGLLPFTRRDRPDMRLEMRKPRVRAPKLVHAPAPSVK